MWSLILIAYVINGGVTIQEIPGFKDEAWCKQAGERIAAGASSNKPEAVELRWACIFK